MNKKGENLITISFKVVLVLVAIGTLFHGAGNLGLITGSAVSTGPPPRIMGIIEVLIGLALIALVIFPKP